MNNGISIYLGLDNTLEENLRLIEEARRCGIGRIFTSLHIPETDVQAMQNQLRTVLKEAKQRGMEVISDVSPNTLALLNMEKLEPDKLRGWGIDTIRLDFGYGCEEIAALSRSGLNIQLNASTAERDFLEKIKSCGTDFSHIDALHNFYPREGTGLSEERFISQNRLLHEYGIRTAAFAPSYNKARSPLKKGLPTLESHRYLPTDFCARHLAQLGADCVFIGDSLPTPGELRELGALKPDYVKIKAKCLTGNEAVKKILAENVFTARADAARSAVRAQESRAAFKDADIAREYTAKRTAGAVALDNNGAARYKGELQIIIKEQPADKNVNVVGMAEGCEKLLLKCIGVNCKFKIEFV